MKHAYLIIAHNDFILLSYLVAALDDVHNDIFIHLDKKVADMPILTVRHARLFFTKQRIDVRWGDRSVVEAEYVLFAEAVQQGVYGYYHLLSGVDMPLKKQIDIRRFFDQHKGKEFIGFSQYDYTKEVQRKVHRYHFFPKDFKPVGGIENLLKRAFRFLSMRVQEVTGYQRNKAIDFKKGTQWVSVTHAFVEYLLSKKRAVMKTYHHTFCSDEIYKQTLCWHSPFRFNIYHPTNEEAGCLRKVGWTNGRIKDWTEDDYEQLMESNALFARKFSRKHFGIVENIFKQLS